RLRLGNHRPHRQPDGGAEGRAPRHAEPALRLRRVRGAVQAAVRLRALTKRLVAAAVLAVAALAATTWQPAQAAAPGSRYLQLEADRTLDGGPTLLLEATLDMPRAAWIYLQSDGVHAPLDAAQANAFITVDGRPVSNDS